MSATNTNRVIGFIDIDAFECQIFQRDQPQYRNKPCVVVTSSGRILSATYEAKALGISRATTPNLRDAIKICPNLYFFRKQDVWGKQDSLKTRHATWGLLDAIQEFCSRVGDDIIVELASSDELYLDISAEVTRGVKKKKEMRHYGFKPIDIPCNIIWERQKGSKRGPFQYSIQKEGHWKNQKKPHLDYIFEEDERLVFGALFMDALCSFLYDKTKLTSSAGVASNKLLAKVGCGLNKPGKITIATSSSVFRIAKLIPIGSIPGLGGTAGDKLRNKLNVNMMSELLKTSVIKLEEEFDTEFSQRILSWAEGKDNQPVVAVTMKDKITCNKPAGLVIKGINNLSKTLQNIVEEIKVRLVEEEERHKRICNSIRLDLTFLLRSKNGSGDNNGRTPVTLSVAYDKKDDKFQMEKLPERALEFIKNQAEFDIRNFQITELGMTMKNFEFVDTIEGLGQKLDNLTLGTAQKTLRVMVKANNTALQPTHQKKKQVGSFRTTSDGKYSSQDIQLPKLNPHDKLFNLRKIYLGQGFKMLDAKNTNLIMDHAGYYEFKHLCFIQWLQESNYFGNFSKPDFIAFHGRIADPMQTPLARRYGGWEIYAMNVHGCIYLWDQKSPQKQVDEIAYYGAYFRALAINEADSIDKVRVQEFDKVYLVNEVSLGKHQILIVNHVSAQDQNGQLTQISLFNQLYWPEKSPQTNTKKLKLWTHSLMAGAQNILIGKRDHLGILQEVENLTIGDLQSQLDGDSSLCLQFENRLLEWIKLHLPVSNDKVVKKFSWVSGHANVVSDVVPLQEVSKLVVPRLYSSFFQEISHNK